MLVRHVVIAATALTLLTSAAQAACEGEDFGTYCSEAVRSGAVNTFNTDRNEGAKRAKTVGDAVKKCVMCGLEKVEEGLDQFRPSGGYDRDAQGTR